MNILDKFFKGNTLFYPGCLTKVVLKDILEKYKKILKDEGIDFIVLRDQEMCCGSPAKNAGAKDEFKRLAEKNLKIFKEHGVDRIISNCPACVAVFRIDYPEILGDKWDIEVQHMTEVIDIEKMPQKKMTGKTATYHDPCHLGRVLGIYDQPREIIKKAGYELVEMELTRNKSFCCGGGGGLKSNDTELSNSIAKDRVELAKQTKADVLITSCPMCVANLKENSGGLETKELSEILI